MANDAFAVLAGTHFQIFIIEDHITIMHFSVLFLNLQWQFFKKFTFRVQWQIAIGVGTDNFLELTDHIDGVFMQAGLAIVAFVFAVSYEDV